MQRNVNLTPSPLLFFSSSFKFIEQCSLPPSLSYLLTPSLLAAFSLSLTNFTMCHTQQCCSTQTSLESTGDIIPLSLCCHLHQRAWTLARKRGKERRGGWGRKEKGGIRQREREGQRSPVRDGGLSALPPPSQLGNNCLCKYCQNKEGQTAIIYCTEPTVNCWVFRPSPSDHVKPRSKLETFHVY